MGFAALKFRRKSRDSQRNADTENYVIDSILLEECILEIIHQLQVS
jgi:hypothetical protein